MLHLLIAWWFWVGGFLYIHLQSAVSKMQYASNKYINNVNVQLIACFLGCFYLYIHLQSAYRKTVSKMQYAPNK